MAQITSLDEAFSLIEQNISEEKWVAAYQICLEVLRADPENLKAIRYKNKIEKNVKKANQNAIEEDIKKLEPLWKEGKYEELLMNLKQLEPFMKDYPKLKSLIIKAKAKYEENLSQDLEKNYQTQIQEIDQLLKQKKYRETAPIMEKLIQMGIHWPEVKKKQQQIYNEWIDNEIELNKILLSGEKYEEMLLFYQKLLKIDPDSIKLKNLIEQTKKMYQSHHIDEKKEFLYKSLEAMRTLYQLKKYEKVVVVCGEILAIDPDNKIVQSYQKKAEKLTQKLITNEVIVQMVANQKSLEEEYKSNRSAFTRI